ncbi:hypothetical protein ACFQ2B_02185 [Streptomyces stramineus]
MPCDFTGRQEQIAAVVSALTGGAEHAVAVITGMGGVGKTSLALRTAHAVAGTYPDGQLYANLRGPDGAPCDPAGILTGFLAALGVPHERFPVSLADRTALFRTLLSQRAVLVVLDNASSVAQVEPLLPGAARCAALITARALAAMPAVLTVPLVGLGPDDAVELIGKVAGRGGSMRNRMPSRRWRRSAGTCRWRCARPGPASRPGPRGASPRCWPACRTRPGCSASSGWES